MKEDTINALDSWVRAVGQELRNLKSEVSGGSDVLSADFTCAERELRDALQQESNRSMNSIELDYFCRDHRGRPSPPNQANIYFVMLNGDCVLATTIFNVANNLFESYVQAGKQSAVLADRRIGDLANYYPTTGVSLDARNTDYYQAQKYGVTEKFVKEHREKCEQDREHIRNLSQPGRWLVLGDTYFYVKALFPSGVLRGYVINHKIPSAIRSSLDPLNLSSWKIADAKTVRRLKLGALLP